MLAWSKSGSGGSRAAPLAAPAAPELAGGLLAGGLLPGGLRPSGLDEFSEDEAGALLACAATASLARRRHAIRIKRKAKVALRIFRSVVYAPFIHSFTYCGTVSF